MNVILWILQCLLAVVFTYSGYAKSTKTEKELMALGQTGVERLKPALIKFIGISELLGVGGIILPWLFKITPVLTPITASCFCLIMTFAAIIHFRRKEYKTAFGNVLIFLASLSVAINRFQEI